MSNKATLLAPNESNRKLNSTTTGFVPQLSAELASARFPPKVPGIRKDEPPLRLCAVEMDTPLPTVTDMLLSDASFIVVEPFDPSKGSKRATFLKSGSLVAGMRQLQGPVTSKA